MRINYLHYIWDHEIFWHYDNENEILLLLLFWH